MTHSSKIIAYTIAAFLSLSLLGNFPAVAETCEGSVVQMTTEVNQAQGFKFVKLSPSEISNLVAEMGPPPVETYDAVYEITNGELSALVVANGDCVLMTTKPMPTIRLDNLLKRGSARNG